LRLYRGALDSDQPGDLTHSLAEMGTVLGTPHRTQQAREMNLRTYGGLSYSSKMGTIWAQLAAR